MGTWGPGPFENDSALDWAGSLTEGNDLEPLSIAIQGLLDGEADVEDEAIAAAEVLAALAGRPCASLPDTLRSWSQSQPAPPAELLALVADAVRHMRTHSELAGLWAESDDLAAWHAAIDDLVRRLGGG